MKHTLLILLLFTLKLNAQITVSAMDFVKSSKTEMRTGGAVIIRAGGYADYSISVPKSGYFTFTLPILNDMGIATYLTLKTTTGTTILATIPVPLSAKWQTFTAQVKLSTVTNKIRVSVGDDITFNSFTYQSLEWDTAAKPRPDGGVSRQEFNRLRQDLDDLLKNLQKNKVYLDLGKSLMKVNDSTFILR